MKKIKVTDPRIQKSFEFSNLNEYSTINKTDGFDKAEIKSVIQDIYGSQGAAFITTSFGRRTFSWQGELFPKSSESKSMFDIRREMLCVMNQNQRMKLIEFETYDGLELRCEAIITNLSVPYTHQIPAYMIEATAPDFRFYSQALVLEEIEANSNKDIENQGTVETPIIFTITGPGKNFTITNEKLGKSFEIQAEIVEGQSIIINTLRKSVTIGGVLNLFSSLSGEIWLLDSGINDIDFQVEQDSTVATKLKLSYRHAYSSI